MIINLLMIYIVFINLLILIGVLKYLIKQHIMGKRRIVFILLAILVTLGLAWNNYSSRNAAIQQETKSVVDSQPVNEDPVAEQPKPAA
jgi:hypothetical protein